MSTSSLTSEAVRSQLLKALQIDLIGPTPEDEKLKEEVLLKNPASWYLAGFLVPSQIPLEERPELDIEDDTPHILNLKPVSGDDDTKQDEEETKKPRFFPSSMGINVLVKPGVKEVEVRASWGEYTETEPSSLLDENGQGDKLIQEAVVSKEKVWVRKPQGEVVLLTLPEEDGSVPKPLPNHPGIELFVTARTLEGTGIVEDGVRSVSIFIVNRRTGIGDEKDATYLFQPRLKLRCQQSFVARPDLRGKGLEDTDEQIADLQYRTEFEFAVGHNIAVKTHVQDSSCFMVETTWLPEAEVEKTDNREILHVEFGMEALAQAKDAKELQVSLESLPKQYRKWIKEAILPKDPKRETVANYLLQRAERVCGRIETGLQQLDDPKVFQAFQLANKVVARAIHQRLGWEGEDVTPAWRPFQLGFLLMSLTGIADPLHEDRECVDLIFFPTGGGKTEAYLGLAAFTLILRRLRHPNLGYAGLSVLMRYTLRLLTLDQLGRASTLLCALELERQKNPELLGDWPFEIGLWVGQGATPNRMGRKGKTDEHSARTKVRRYQQDPATHDAPIPLESCPWCNHSFTPSSFELFPNADEPKELRILCSNNDCTYGKVGRRGRITKQYLPILTVDEPIYRRLPCFLIATVDKFASLPWVGQTGALLGQADRYKPGEGFYGDSEKGQGIKLGEKLLPPDLIIQDELHLISGPLGTMVGLYETALDLLCEREYDGKRVRPKIVASTATVRRAAQQIQALFSRSHVELFPPQGPNRRDTFFSITRSSTEKNARLYVGVAAQGRSSKVVLLRVYRTLLSAAQKLWNEAGGAKNPENPVDPYMTILGYFSSLKALGGSRRIVEDEIQATLQHYGWMRRKPFQTESMLATKRMIQYEPVELTSRVSTAKVAEAKDRLSKTFHNTKKRVDVALATNMISVGLDIPRLGLMIVLGQPQTTSEYIQSTSRVGRDEKRPGLVITLLNMYKARDRSHYERFETWHRSFYRNVEATSVTPFSPRALDRGLAAVTVALVRHRYPALASPRGAEEFINFRDKVNEVVGEIAKRAAKSSLTKKKDEIEELELKVQERVKGILDDWYRFADHQVKVGALLQYQQEEGKAPPLLLMPLDPALETRPEHARTFKAYRSLRDVEPEVPLFVRKDLELFSVTEGEEI